MHASLGKWGSFELIRSLSGIEAWSMLAALFLFKGPWAVDFCVLLGVVITGGFMHIGVWQWSSDVSRRPAYKRIEWRYNNARYKEYNILYWLKYYTIENEALSGLQASQLRWHVKIIEITINIYRMHARANCTLRPELVVYIHDGHVTYGQCEDRMKGIWHLMEDQLVEHWDVDTAFPVYHIWT